MPPGQPQRPGDGDFSGPYGPPGLRKLDQLKQVDPELYELEKADAELERQTMELSSQFRRAPRTQREALKKQITELVSKHFTVRQARRELHLKRLQEELEQLRQAIERRNEIRDEIIGRRVGELIGPSSDLDF